MGVVHRSRPSPALAELGGSAKHKESSSTTREGFDQRADELRG